jgi:uncharacterized SAM-binding protein YcdF (DUF218 family)
MIEFLKETMRPSSIPCLLMLLAPGLALLYVRPLARWGRRWLAALLVAYWSLSAPISVRVLTRTLMHGYAPVEASQVSGAQAVVLLGGGSLNVRLEGQQLSVVTASTALRALEAARVYRMAGAPLVIVSGGVTERRDGAAPESEALRLALVHLAVPPERIVSESTSKNTRDEAVLVAEMLRARGITRVVMVTSPLHMWRSMVVFARQGVHPIPAIAPLAPSGRDFGVGVLPTESALLVGDAVAYEWAACAYYWWRGWLS